MTSCIGRVQPLLRCSAGIAFSSAPMGLLFCQSELQGIVARHDGDQFSSRAETHTLKVSFLWVPLN